MKTIYKIDYDLVFDSLEKIMLNDMVNQGYFIIQAYERKGLNEGYRIFTYLYDSTEGFNEEELEDLKKFQLLKYSRLTQVQYNEHLDTNGLSLSY